MCFFSYQKVNCFVQSLLNHFRSETILFNVTACFNITSASANTIDIFSDVTGSIILFLSKIYSLVILNDSSIFISYHSHSHIIILHIKEYKRFWNKWYYITLLYNTDIYTLFQYKLYSILITYQLEDQTFISYQFYRVLNDNQKYI